MSQKGLILKHIGPALLLKLLVIYLCLHYSVAEKTSKSDYSSIQLYTQDEGNFENICFHSKGIARTDLVFAGLIFIISTVLILGFIRVKEMREPPGDIVLALAVSNLILSIEWGVQSVLKLHNMIDDKSVSCSVTGIFDVFSRVFSSFYIFAFFCFYFSATRPSLKITNIPQYLWHLVPLCVASPIILLTSYFDQYGLDDTCICSFNPSNATANLVIGILWQGLSLLLLVIFPVYMSWAVGKSLPECRAFSLARYKFLRHYRAYVIVIALINLILCVIGMILAGTDSNTEDMGTWITVLKYIDNVFTVLAPLALISIRLFDPNLKQYWYRVFCCYKASRESLQVNLLGEVLTEDLDGRRSEVSLSMREIRRNLKGTPSLIQIQLTRRIQGLYSLLSAVHYFWRISKTTQLTNYANSADGYKVNYKKLAKMADKVLVNEASLKRELPEIAQELRIKDNRIFEGALTAYAPAIFGEIVEMDKEMSALRISLDLSANYHQILKAGNFEGGKSGEFFFSSYDNKLIIKTISDRELHTLLDILPYYSEHFKSNPNSLIAKIYGAFTFERLKPYEKYNLIIMKNVSGLPSHCIERKYDLKGSTYGRATVKQGDPEIHQLKRYPILKDKDFDRFEKKINIEQSIQGNLLKALKKDTEFLQRNKLIDYSLVVYIVDKVKLNNNTEESFERTISIENPLSCTPDIKSSLRMSPLEIVMVEESPTQTRTKSLLTSKAIRALKVPSQSLQSIRSTKEAFYYHVGIIDYLVQYTNRKRLEKFGKKILACNSNIDISVQHQDYYAERFDQYMQKIIKG